MPDDEQQRFTQPTSSHSITAQHQNTWQFGAALCIAVNEAPAVDASLLPCITTAGSSNSVLLD
jgi:hypothetical protein